jgi:16S rRNA (guanine966-N2)-methyltransferase
VTGGALRGRRLRVPRGNAVRPTSDRVRESLFARLGDLEGSSVLDLYAGSGALGVESLSRGAATLVSVERSAAAAAIIQANWESLGVADRARLVRADVEVALQRLARESSRFDLVLVDPPYAETEATGRALRALATSGILAPHATVVVEASRRAPPPAAPGLVAVDERRYGDTVLHWLEPAAATSGSEERA